MPTPYPEREHEHDLGAGHSFIWLLQGEKIVGLIEHHPRPSRSDLVGQYCGGYISWAAGSPTDGEDPHFARRSNHQLVAGGEGDEEHLTISPSLKCRSCPNHGWIRDGIWIDA